MSFPRAKRWNTIRIRPTLVHSGRSYWIAVLAERGGPFFSARRDGACVGARSSVIHLTALPSRVQNVRRLHACPISAYASGTVNATDVLLASPRPRRLPVNTAVPAISGTAQVADTLSASKGSWSNNPSSFAYQWQDCLSGTCQNIAGATSSSYAVQSSVVGGRIDVVVTATNAHGSASATSPLTGVVLASPPPPPANTAVPTITGTPQVSDTLSASRGSWSNSPSSYAYRWQDCNASGASCSNITGASSSTYTVGSSDVGHTIDVVVAATNAGGSAMVASVATSTVPSLPTVSAVTTSHVTSTSATFTVTINPNGTATIASFDYGTTTSYGLTTPRQNIGSATTPQTVTATVTGLTPGTTYHVRAAATQ